MRNALAWVLVMIALIPALVGGILVALGVGLQIIAERVRK